MSDLRGVGRAERVPPCLTGGTRSARPTLRPSDPIFMGMGGHSKGDDSSSFPGPTGEWEVPCGWVAVAEPSRIGLHDRDRNRQEHTPLASRPVRCKSSLIKEIRARSSGL